MAGEIANLDRLKSQLLTSGLSQRDQPLFQIINQLIDALRGTINITTGGSGGGGPIGGQTFLTYADETGSLPNSLQAIPGNGIQFTKQGKKLLISANSQIVITDADAFAQADAFPIQGQQGIPGKQGERGIPGLDGEDGLEGIGIQGLKGDKGETGAPGLDGACCGDGESPYSPTDDLFALEGTESSEITTSTGTANDFNFAQKSVLYCNNATDLTITGFIAGRPNQRLVIISKGAGNVFLQHQNAGSGAANRLINFVTSGDTPLAGGFGKAEYVYDNVSARWRLVQHFQGTTLTPAFNAADYTANGGGTWTVASGDVSRMAYYIMGRMIFIAVVLNTTTTVGAATTELRRVVPGGYTINGENLVADLRVNAAAAWQTGMFYGASGATFMRFFYDLSGAANWPATVDTTYIQGALAFEVQ